MDFTGLIKSKYPELSKSQQKIAKYILDNLDEAVFDTACQLGKKNDVSETTIIRFAYALGFEGYADMNKAMRKSVLNNTENSSSASAAKDMGNLSASQLDEYFKTEIIQRNKAYQNISFEEFKKICEIIMNSKKVLIIGYMDSFGVASELLHVLDKLRSKVYFYRLLYEERNMLYEMGEDSLVIAVSFSPHYKYTFEHTETAKQGGCKVITLTDSIINPFTGLSDHTLVFNVQRNAEINLIDMSPVTRFIFFMMNYIYAKYKKKVNQYRNSIEMRIEKYIE